MHKRSLLELSVKAAVIQDVSDYSVHWLSDQRILFMRGSEREDLYIYDTRTRKETLLEQISREWHKTNSPNTEHSLVVSPDGTRVLWSTEQHILTPFEAPTYGAWLDGSHFFQCDSGGDSWKQVCWASDSRHWAAFVHTRHARPAVDMLLYDSDSARNPEKYYLTTPRQSDLLMLMGGLNSQRLLSGDHLLVWEDTMFAGVIPTLEILDIQKGKHAPEKTHLFPLLPNTAVMALAFSPQGDRVAWHQVREELPEWVRILQRWFPHMYPQGVKRESLWVSHIDGTERHEIGGQNLDSSEEARPLSNLQWVPGSNRLGFRYGAACYTVSAE